MKTEYTPADLAYAGRVCRFICYSIGLALTLGCGKDCMDDYASAHEPTPSGCNRELIYFAYVSIGLQLLIGIAAAYNDNLVAWARQLCSRR